MTNEARAVLLSLYKDYKEKRDQEIPRNKAKRLEGYSELNERLFPKIDPETFVDILRELGKNDFLHIQYAENVPWIMYFTNEAIEEMENVLFKDILSGLATLKAVIPFL